MRVSLFFVVALLASVCVASTLPSIVANAQENATGKFFLHSRALDFFQKIVNSILENALKNVAFPDDSVKVPGGHLHLSGTVLKDVTFVAQEVGLIPPNQLSIDLDNFQGAVESNWKYHGPLGIHFHGSADITFAQTTINTLFTFSSDSVGRPVLTLTNTAVSIDDLNIKLHGGGAWLFNFIIRLVKRMLIKKLERAIESVASKEFNQILSDIEAKYPLAIPLSGKLLEGSQLNLPLVPTIAGKIVDDSAPRPFSMTSDYLVAAGEFSFSSTTNTTVDSRIHDWIPDTLPLNKDGEAPMMGFAFDEAFMGTLLYTITQNGRLNFHLDDAGNKFTTNTLALEYPALYAKYPNSNLTLDISQYENSPPLATTSPMGSSWSNSFVIQLNVIDATSTDPTPLPVCQMLVNYTLDSMVTLSDNSTGVYLGGNISPLKFQATMIWASLDPAQFPSAVEGLVTAIANYVLVPLIDATLAKGIKVGENTIEAFPISNMFVSYQQHVFAFGFDISMPAEEEAGLAQVEAI